MDSIFQLIARGGVLTYEIKQLQRQYEEQQSEVNTLTHVVKALRTRLDADEASAESRISLLKQRSQVLEQQLDYLEPLARGNIFLEMAYMVVSWRFKPVARELIALNMASVERHKRWSEAAAKLEAKMQEFIGTMTLLIAKQDENSLILELLKVTREQLVEE